jgi:hypothetical protein
MGGGNVHYPVDPVISREVRSALVVEIHACFAGRLCEELIRNHGQQITGAEHKPGKANPRVTPRGLSRDDVQIIVIVGFMDLANFLQKPLAVLFRQVAEHLAREIGATALDGRIVFLVTARGN